MANAGWTTTSSHLVQEPPQYMLTCSGHFLRLYQFISWTLERTESRAGKQTDVYSIHMHAYHVMLLAHLQTFYPTFDNYSQRAACVMSEVPTFAQSPRHLVQDLEGGFSPALKWLAHHKDWICLKITLKIEQLVWFNYFFLWVFVGSSIHPSIHPFIHWSMDPWVHSSTHPSIYPSIHPSIHPDRQTAWKSTTSFLLSLFGRW